MMKKIQTNRLDSVVNKKSKIMKKRFLNYKFIIFYVVLEILIAVFWGITWITILFFNTLGIGTSGKPILPFLAPCNLPNSNVCNAIVLVGYVIPLIIFFAVIALALSALSKGSMRTFIALTLLSLGIISLVSSPAIVPEIIASFSLYPIPKTPPIQEWKTYTNDSYQFSFKYPPNSTLTENKYKYTYGLAVPGGDEGDFTGNVELKLPVHNPNTFGGNRTASSKRMTIQIQPRTNYNSYFENVVKKSAKTVTIGKNTALYETPNVNGSIMKYYYLTSSKYLYVIDVVDFLPKDTSDLPEKIIATFKILY
jgi:hypothetical protein